MQDNIRYTQQLLTRITHLAGYKSQANSVTSTVFSGSPALDSPNPIPTGSDPDVFSVRFQGSGLRTSAPNCQAAGGCPGADGTVVDCLGLAIDAGVIAVNTFSIRLRTPTVPPALLCNGAEIVPDVANMQILYGEDLNGDLVADRYVSPEVTGGNTSAVVSVRVALLFETPTDTSMAVPDAKKQYDMLGDGTAQPDGSVVGGTVVLGPFADRRIRRLVTMTINLRNRTP